MASQLEIRAPAEQTEGTRSQVLRWLKAIGDTVVENEPLIEIETDKVTVEVASPGSGTLREIVKQEQEEISPGDLLGRIEGGEGAVAIAGRGPGVDAERVTGHGGSSAAHAPSADGERKSGAAARVAGTPGTGTSVGGTSVGGPSVGGTSVGGPSVGGTSVGGPSVGGTSVGGPSVGGPSVGGPSVGGTPARRDAAARALSPAVRRLLAERGLDAANVAGTGQDGRITVADVMSHQARSSDVAASADRNAGASPTATAPDREMTSSNAAATTNHGTVESNTGSADGGAAKVPQGSKLAAASALGPSRRIPHTVTRKRIAEHMVQSLLQTAPHVTTVFEADLTAVLEHRQRHKDEFASRGVQLTLTAYFLQAAVAAIREVPESNSRWMDDALEVYESAHIGVATALESGLAVPVLRDVQSRDLFETAKGLEDLVTRAREGRLSPTDMRGGTFTISNHGVSGSLVATPIVINQPQSAILGIGKLEKRAVVVSENGEDRIIVRPQCYVSLTIDHRVMDGHQANRFLQVFVQWLATPRG